MSARRTPGPNCVLRAARDDIYLSSFTTIWFLDGPPATEVIDGSESSLRYALDDGRGWAVIQEQIHPWQADVPHELRVSPAGMFESMSYRLGESGAELSQDLRALTFERTQPLEEIFGNGQLCLVTTAEMQILGTEWQFEQHQTLVTMHRSQWLAALHPASTAGRRFAESNLPMAGRTLV